MTVDTQVDKILQEIDKRFYDIPFENSKFQNENFIIHAAQTPGRAYRAIGLRMYSKIQAINELKYARKIDEVELDENTALVKSWFKSKFKKRRAAIEIEKKQSMINHTDKLLNDAIEDLNFMYAKLQEFPEYTREQFELEERDYFTNKLELSLMTDGNGARESLAYIDPENILRFEQNKNEAKQLIDSKNEYKLDFSAMTEKQRFISNQHPLAVDIINSIPSVTGTVT